jgi:hypothetical protein
MGIKKSVLIYTHTDYEDVWDILFDGIVNYLENYDIYFGVNKVSEKIPTNFKVIYYDDKLAYTERLKEILSKLEVSTFIFMHEDMVLYDNPKHEFLDKYFKLVNDGVVDSIKLILAGSNFITSDIDETLVENEYSKFSIQPTIIKKETLVNLLNTFCPLNIWDFETEIISKGRDFMCKIGKEKKRGLCHYDSSVFPYIATAIVKGKWNYSEYENELKILHNKYNIDPYKRGLYKT